MSLQTDLIFETVDHEGTPVVLSRATWTVKAGNGEPGAHPEVRGYLEDVKNAVASPDLVFQSTRDERSYVFYRLQVGRDDFAGKRLVAVVKYIQQATGRRGGYVSTMYLSRAVYSQGRLLWPMTASSSR
jgi:hypothetical protein